MPVPLHPPPDQPANADPDAADALKLTLVPELNPALHVAPQLIPVGVEVTVPAPVPPLATESVYV